MNPNLTGRTFKSRQLLSAFLMNPARSSRCTRSRSRSTTTNKYSTHHVTPECRRRRRRRRRDYLEWKGDDDGRTTAGSVCRQEFVAF
ncbi:hypothetical protein ACLKA6_009968 [Drosophila palustris]